MVCVVIQVQRLFCLPIDGRIPYTIKTTTIKHSTILSNSPRSERERERDGNTSKKSIKPWSRLRVVSTQYTSSRVVLSVLQLSHNSCVRGSVGSAAIDGRLDFSSLQRTSSQYVRESYADTAAPRRTQTYSIDVTIWLR
jgi:hypothetical protein